ncbi:MAG TPA: hypothetical protein DCE41_26425 [Cytophagales bacterium]|nr:hypothetical protein [Cytophagales bacterium]HAA20139.1 hypothetical protein [Cytophagales bacterium]HAP60944.1 hypothetical protein [Cytophagales bacterium]
MRTPLILFTFVMGFSSAALGQPNCNVYLYQGDTTCYEACKLAVRGGGRQGSQWSQEKFAAAFEQCPQLDYAIFEQAVPYLKRGDMVTWKKMIDQAVAINPMHLGYRGWCRFQFARDYDGCIADLTALEEYYQGGDIGYSVNGSYHLKVAMALCYKMKGNRPKAIALIEAQLAKKDYSPMANDYLHLGVMYLEQGQYTKATTALEKSIELNDFLAENYYYLGLVYKARNQRQAYQDTMRTALAYYAQGKHLYDDYSHPIDRIYRAQIEEELASFQ